MTLTLSDGRRTRGTVDVNTPGGQRQEVIAPYMLRVNRRAAAHAADVLIYEGARYILGDDVTEASGAPQFRVLRMFTSTGRGDWKRTVTTTDPVSGLPKGTSLSTLGTSVDFGLWRLGAITDAFAASTSKYSLISGATLQVGDQIGSYTVTYAEQHYGITLAEVK
jgi:hypothetical protein